MNQDLVASATAEKRSRWHALRPWLVLGGFVAVWWILATGTAQADSTPRHQLNVAETVSGLTHGTAVRHLAVRGPHVSRNAVTHGATAVHPPVATVGHTTRSTVAVTTRSLREVANGQFPTIVVKPVSTLVETTHNTVGGAVPSGLPLPESSTTQGDSAAQHAFAKSAAKSAAESSAAAVPSTSKALDDTFEVFPIAFAARTASALGEPFQAPAHGPTEGPVSVTLAMTSLMLIGLVGVLVFTNRSASQRSRMRRLVRLPGGVFFEPGSSPD